jgi:hypothetical protein
MGQVDATAVQPPRLAHLRHRGGLTHQHLRGARVLALEVGKVVALRVKGLHTLVFCLVFGFWGFWGFCF